MSSNGSSTVAFDSPSSIGEFRNEPPFDFSKREERDAFQRALGEAKRLFPRDVPGVIDGQSLETKEVLEGFSPNDNAMKLSRQSMAGVEDADRAVAAARKAYPRWSNTSPAERAALMLKLAERLRSRRHLLAAVMVYEGAKPWREADGDVCEAIDFLEYYAREMLRLSRPRRLQPHILGERNELSYHPLGVVGVIGPWNFPLAIPLGMTSAALVAGNTVILKPAEQTPVILSLLMEQIDQAGFPKGVVNFLPGRGEVCGARLVSHPQVNMIAFTGSRDVGCHIIREAANTPKDATFVKRVVAEMGGKNAIIVDSSADIDSAVPDILYSAFGYSGQKCSACSRAILLADVYDDIIPRLKEGAASLHVGPADEPGTQLGPVIDAEAAAKVKSYVELGRKEARAVYVSEPGDLEAKGAYVPHAVFENVQPGDRLAQEEIFGPVLSVLKARDFKHALEIANGTPYALTGGVHSRTLKHLELARRHYNAGNLYLNRTTTGAVVGRQPFGGFNMSGVGSKAGGPDYLKQFLVARVATENLMRHGFAPLAEETVAAEED